MNVKKILTVSALVIGLTSANLAVAGDSFGFFYSKDNGSFSYSSGIPFHHHHHPPERVVEHHHFYHEHPHHHHHHHHHCCDDD